jgi:hypothetical protein
MSQEILTDATPALRPIASSERIQALDVVRGFALIGIFLMNIEWFNRPIAELGMGLPSTLQGADWWAGYLIYILVQGKFWTMFSLLFGMGFAVMLTPAERAGRGFLVPYVRRIARSRCSAPATTSSCGRATSCSATRSRRCACCCCCGRAGGADPHTGSRLRHRGPGAGAQMVGAVGFGMSMVLLGAWFLRGEARVARVPSQSCSSGCSAHRAWASRDRGRDAERSAGRSALAGAHHRLLPAAARHAVLALQGSGRARPRRLGVTMYLVPFLIMLSFGLLQVYGPERPKASEAQVAAAMVVAKAERAAEEAGTPAPKPADAKAAKKKSPTEQAAMREAQRRIGRTEHDEEVATERRLQTTGSYLDFVRFRAKEFAEHSAGEFGFATVLIGMFLLGYWFVRTGVMEHPDQHLPLFRKLAYVGLPLGVGLGSSAA